MQLWGIESTMHLPHETSVVREKKDAPSLFPHFQAARHEAGGGRKRRGGMPKKGGKLLVVVERPSSSSSSSSSFLAAVRAMGGGREEGTEIPFEEDGRGAKRIPPLLRRRKATRE